MKFSWIEITVTNDFQFYENLIEKIFLLKVEEFASRPNKLKKVQQIKENYGGSDDIKNNLKGE